MSDNLLRNYFPMIRTRAEITDLISANPHLMSVFQSWKPEQQAVTGAASEYHLCSD